MILLAMRTGRKRMICGGAHRANDGVLRFKAGFSPLRAQFQVYKRIHDAGTYAGLTGAWSRHFDGAPAEASYFPAYRAGAPDPEEPPPAAAGAPVQALNPNLDAIRS
jgi:hypothetical protein